MSEWSDASDLDLEVTAAVRSPGRIVIRTVGGPGVGGVWTGCRIGPGTARLWAEALLDAADRAERLREAAEVRKGT